MFNLCKKIGDVYNSSLKFTLRIDGKSIKLKKKERIEGNFICYPNLQMIDLSSFSSPFFSNFQLQIHPYINLYSIFLSKKKF